MKKLKNKYKFKNINIFSIINFFIFIIILKNQNKKFYIIFKK